MEVPERVRLRAGRRREPATRSARTHGQQAARHPQLRARTARRSGAFPTPSTYPQVDPLNFSDIGYDLTGPEVHADGEIWVAINFEHPPGARRQVQRGVPGVEHGAAAALRERRGARRTSARATGAGSSSCTTRILLMPIGPSMLEARDAYPRRGHRCASAARTRTSSGSSSRGAASARTRSRPRHVRAAASRRPRPDAGLRRRRAQDERARSPSRRRRRTRANIPVNARIYVG